MPLQFLKNKTETAVSIIQKKLQRTFFTTCPIALVAIQFFTGDFKKLKDIGGEIWKKLNSPGPVDFPLSPRLTKNYVQKL